MFKLRQRTLKDVKRRNLFSKFELTRNLYNAIAKSTTIPSIIRVYAAEKLFKLNRDSSFSRIRNRCIITSRSRGVIGNWNINRIKFRELAMSGKLPGIKLYR